MANEIPEAAIYKGPPSQGIINRIKTLTRVDSDGCLYWRKLPGGPWRRLRSDEDYMSLNVAIYQDGQV